MESLKVDTEKISGEITNFLKEEFAKRSKKTAILAVSGGIDSAVSAFFCKRAELDLYTIILPHHGKGDDGKKLAETLGLTPDHIIVIDIAPLVDASIAEIEKTLALDHIDKGNIMARQRMIIQYAFARKLNGLVIGTENLSEYYLGYFTLHGDQACDISPISSLWKTQVYQMAEYLGVPEWVIKREPSAGLWDGQTDEKEFGFTYRDADKIMNLYILKKIPAEEIVKKYDFNLELVNKVIARVKNTEYKRQKPPTLLF